MGDLSKDFTLLSGPIKATSVEVTKDDGSKETVHYLEGIASSTVEDRQGDTLDAQAQQSMLEQSKNLTMFLNHSYKIPEDVLGTCEESTLTTGMDENGSPTIDLNIKVRIQDQSARALQSWKIISAGTKLGFSIGGRVLDFTFKDDDSDAWMPGMIVHDIELLEISLVGVPANPRAYTRAEANNIARSLRRGIEKQEPDLFKAASTDPQARLRLRELLGVKPMEPTKVKDAEAVNDELARMSDEELEARKNLGSKMAEAELNLRKDDADDADDADDDDEGDKMRGRLIKCKDACKDAMNFHKDAAPSSVSGSGGTHIHAAHGYCKDAFHACEAGLRSKDADEMAGFHKDAMKAMKDAMACHVKAGVASAESYSRIKDAHAALKAIQPDGAPMPDNDHTPPTPAGGGDVGGKSLDELKAEVTAELTLAFNAEFAAAKAALESVKSDKTKAEDELKKLTEKIAAAKAQPLGRKTFANFAGRPNDDGDEIMSRGVRSTSELADSLKKRVDAASAPPADGRLTSVT